MAHKKGVGSTKNGRDSESKRLGVKLTQIPSDDSLFWQETSWLDSAEQRSIRV